MKEKYVPPTYQKKGFSCPHCGVYAEQEWIAPRYSLGNANIDGLNISICKYCDATGQRKFAYSVWVNQKLVFPISSTAPLASEEMPEEVKEVYNEARNIADLSPSAAAALLRLALQKLVVKLGYKGKDLNKDIGKLIKDKKLPDNIGKSLDSVRIIGNYAVHPGEIELKDDTKTTSKLFGFLNLIVDYTITHPKEVNELFEKIPEEKREAIKKRNGEKD